MTSGSDSTAATATTRPLIAAGPIERAFIPASRAGSMPSAFGGVLARAPLAAAVLVVRRTLVGQHADGHRLAEQQRLEGVGAPVDAGEVAAGGDVRGQLVELPAEGKRGAAPVRPEG